MNFISIHLFYILNFHVIYFSTQIRHVLLLLAAGHSPLKWRQFVQKVAAEVISSALVRDRRGFIDTEDK